MTEEGGVALDPRDPKHHLFWCKKCEAPVASSDWRGAIVIACAGCGFEERRDVHMSRAPRDELSPVLYRDPAPAKAVARILTVDVNMPIQGHDVSTVDAPDLRKAIAKKAAVPEDRQPREWEVACEWEATWIATWVALFRAIEGNHLAARIALETALDATKTQEYRALLLARLAIHAGGIGATKLAKRWLAACPHVDAVEVRSEVAAARAMLALARKDYWRVIDATGGSIAGTDYVGVCVYLAIALNVEACDRRGDYVVADAIMRDARKKDLMRGMTLWMTAFGLAQDGLRRLNRWVQKRDADVATTFASIAVVLISWMSGRLPLGSAMFALFVCGGFVYMLTWVTFSRRAFTRLGKPFRIGTTAAIAVAVVGLFAAAVIR